MSCIPERNGSLTVYSRSQLLSYSSPRITALANFSGNFLYLVVQDIGAHSGSGMDFICGMVFLERFYTIYDTGNSHLGLATTQFTIANICCFVSELF